MIMTNDKLKLPILIIPVHLFCPRCGARHLDEEREGERWDRRAHSTHRCQKCKEDFDVYVSGCSDVDTASGMSLRELEIAK